MTAINKGFRTRAQLSLRAPRSVSHNITPANGGVAVHWNGGPVGAKDHARCESHWRNDQNYHMDQLGWADIAYTGGFCQHGICLAGRGFGVRTAANGSNAGNQNHYAFCWLGGTGEVPTGDAYNALEWWVNEARVHGGAGKNVLPHNVFYATACPGGELRARATLLNNRPLYSPSPTSTPPQVKPPVSSGYTIANVKALQGAVSVVTDGKWGNNTDSNAMNLRAAARGSQFNVREVQRIVGVTIDGMFGPKSKAGVVSRTLSVQRAVKVSADGAWGPITDGAFNTIRNQFHNKF